MSAKFDVAIVGAGPAGSSCANAYLAAGAGSVALIDRARFPRDKSCGDGMGAGTVHVLDRLGLGHVVAGKPVIKRAGMHFHDRIHVEIDTDLYERPSPLGYVIPRIEFDAALATAALDRGAADLTGWSLEDAWPQGEGWRLSLQHTGTGETRQIDAGVLIGADGARSRVRRVLKQPFNSDEHTAVAIRAYVDVPTADKGYQRLDVLEALPHPGYAWVFCDGSGRANIGLGCSVRAWKRERPKFDELLAAYCDALDGQVSGTPEALSSAILPVGFRRMPIGFAPRRAALVGDAASMIHPAAGEGIFFGMYGGMILGEALAAGPAETAIAGYDRAFRKAFSTEFRDAWILLRLLSYKTVLKHLVSDFEASPDMCYDFIEFLMGVMPPRRSRPLAALAADAVAQRLRAALPWAR